MSSSWEMDDAPEGSCETSGTLSQKITRSLEEPDEMAAQTLEESANEPGAILVLFRGVLGSCENCAWPAYLD